MRVKGMVGKKHLERLGVGMMSERQSNNQGIDFTVLDDPQQIASIDTSQMLETLARFPEQITEALTITQAAERYNFIKIDNVIISGMGASGISGDIIASLLRDKVDVPIYVNREDTIPKWANKDTLIIFISYSGDTEETLNAFKVASQKKCKTICISSGGKLKEFTEKRELPFLQIPQGLHPRAATAYLLFPSLLLLKRTGLLKTTLEDDIQETISVTRDLITSIAPSIPETANLAKQLAHTLYGSIPQIYGWEIYAPIATRWRQQFNENSKIIARADTVPENTHNDIMGWAGNPELSKLFSCILFRDKDVETLPMTTRLVFLKNLFESTAAHVLEVSPKGKSSLAKMMYLMCLGDFTSCYLAILRGIDPTPIDIIREMKNRLAEK